jgi:hypothetical protein
MPPTGIAKGFCRDLDFQDWRTAGPDWIRTISVDNSPNESYSVDRAIVRADETPAHI